MCFSKIKLFAFILSCLTSLSFAQYIQVDDNFSAQQLVEDILMNSPCANVSNISVSGNTFSPVEQSYGYFKNNKGNLPFFEGILLASSTACRACGPNGKLIHQFKGDKKTWYGKHNNQELTPSDYCFTMTLENGKIIKGHFSLIRL